MSYEPRKQTREHPPIPAVRVLFDLTQTAASDPADTQSGIHSGELMLDKKVCIVTGAGSGIGRAAARALALAGGKIVVCDVDHQAGDATVGQIQRARGEAIFIAADVSRPDQCEALVSRTVERFGRLDVAVNNAEIGGEAKSIADTSLQAWDRVIGVNLSGVFYCMKYQLPHLVKQRGTIVNVASVLGQVGWANAGAYAAAKHGVVGLTRTAALEYGSLGVRVNAVGPGFVKMPMVAGLEQDAASPPRMTVLNPLGRIGQVDEVAEVILWLSTPAASFVTGAYYPVDGGFLAAS